MRYLHYFMFHFFWPMELLTGFSVEYPGFSPTSGFIWGCRLNIQKQFSAAGKPLKGSAKFWALMLRLLSKLLWPLRHYLSGYSMKWKQTWTKTPSSSSSPLQMLQLRFNIRIKDYTVRSHHMVLTFESSFAPTSPEISWGYQLKLLLLRPSYEQSMSKKIFSQQGHSIDRHWVKGIWPFSFRPDV